MWQCGYWVGDLLGVELNDGDVLIYVLIECGGYDFDWFIEGQLVGNFIWVLVKEYWDWFVILFVELIDVVIVYWGLLFGELFVDCSYDLDGEIVIVVL